MVDEDQAAPERPFNRYVRVLEPLFDPTGYPNIGQLFELICCLVRVGGIEAKDSDPLGESTALVQDLNALSTLPLDPATFPSPERTRARLALISYCHLTEVNFFYELLANLLRVRAVQPFHFDPFFDLRRKTKKKAIPPSPGKKIERILQLAAAANFDGLQDVFKDVYLRDIRNGVFHADYALTERDFLMRNGLYMSPKGYLTPAVPFDELENLLERSFSFYSALLALHARARNSFRDFKNKLLPFDVQYKGLLEILFEDGALTGFRVYWPNGGHSEFNRTKTGCVAMNLTVGIKGGVELMVGLYASKRGSFSPLVEHDAAPVYTPAPGRTNAPYWPEDLKPYEAQ